MADDGSGAPLLRIAQRHVGPAEVAVTGLVQPHALVATAETVDQYLPHAFES